MTTLWILSAVAGIALSALGYYYMRQQKPLPLVPFKDKLRQLIPDYSYILLPNGDHVMAHYVTKDVRLHRWIGYYDSNGSRVCDMDEFDVELGTGGRVTLSGRRTKLAIWAKLIMNRTCCGLETSLLPFSCTNYHRVEEELYMLFSDSIVYLIGNYSTPRGVFVYHTVADSVDEICHRLEV